MQKTIKVHLTIKVDGKKLTTNMDMEEVATLGDVVAICHALDISSDVTRGQIREFMYANGDIPQEDWPDVPASKVLLKES